MLTAVALLFFPFVLGMSLYRIYQLPRDVLAGKKWFNRARPLAALLASSVTYLTLFVYTATLLVTLVSVLVRVPKAINEVLSVVSILAGYPFVYLAYEWVYHYALDPRPKSY